MKTCWAGSSSVKYVKFAIFYDSHLRNVAGNHHIMSMYENHHDIRDRDLLSLFRY